jgi:hypothetical protein
MQDAPGVSEARTWFYVKNVDALISGSDDLQAVTGYKSSFGLTGLLAADSWTRQFVGSFTINIYPNLLGTQITFVLYNNSSFQSFAEGIGPAWNRGSIITPMGNMTQYYIWTEPITTRRH